MHLPRPSLSLVRDAVLVAAIAVVTVQALRRWCGDRYLVPTGSMEPVLHGDPEHGDVVFVGKWVDAAARRRPDLVVVQHPSERGQQMVKRIAARGDDGDACWIDIKQGDVWLGPDAQRVEREQKDPLLARGQRVVWAATSDPSDFASLFVIAPRDDAGAQLPAANTVDEARAMFDSRAREERRRDPTGMRLPERCTGTRRPVDAGFVDATGARSKVGSDVGVNDCGMTIELTAIAGELLATIETSTEALTWHWQPTTGRVALWRDGVEGAANSWPPDALPRTVEFGLLDGRVFFCLDGRRERLLVLPRPAATGDGREQGLKAEGRRLVYLAVVGGSMTWRSLAVFRDVFAYRDPIAGLPGQPGSWPRFVPPGHWFLLGDSAFDSRDSRHFGPVPATAFLGVPWCVLGPWPRARWVRP